MMTFGRVSACVLAAATLILGGCGSSESARQRQEEANTPAGKVGKAAHEVAREAGKAATFAGQKLDKAAHQAREGWEESEREDRAKGKH